MLKFLLIGTGHMAKVRTDAFLSTKKVELTAVCSKRLCRAKETADKYHCDLYFDNYKDAIDQVNADFVLVETPHDVQQEVVEYALIKCVDVFIGGVGATSVADAEKILALSKKNNCMVEAGIEAKYKDVWLKVQDLTKNNSILGSVTYVQSCALFPASKDSWYYSQSQSGGMLETHFSYAFLSVFNWLFGSVSRCHLVCSSSSNRKKNMILEDSASISIQYKNNVICSSLVSYVAPSIPEHERWYVNMFFTNGMLKIHPSDQGAGEILCYIPGHAQERIEFSENKAFYYQALKFIKSIENRVFDGLENTPEVFVYDCEIIDQLHSSKSSYGTLLNRLL